MYKKKCPVCGTMIVKKYIGQLRAVKTCSMACKNTYHAKPLAELLWRRVEKPNKNGCMIWQGKPFNNGYGYVAEYVDKKKRVIGVHCAAYELTYGKIPKGMFVCHHCDNKLCCNPEHLFLGTNRENINDMLKKGRSLKGIKHHSSKLTEKQVKEIRKKYDGKKRTASYFAKKFNVGTTCIYSVIHKHTWRHIK